MAKDSSVSKSPSLEELALEAVRLQADHRCGPKEARLLNLFSKSTSTGQHSGLTDQGLRDMHNDHALIGQIMAKTGMTEEEAVQELKLWGGL